MEFDITEEIKLQVFNDLYNFFSRYYEEGDFINKYRYLIKGHKYAIPYNGEEVKLYWVNSDQYYTKTGLLFRDYTFKLSDYKIVFRTVEAKEELGSNKATKERFFILNNDNAIEFDKEYKTLIVKFQYRELYENEINEIKRFRKTKEEVLLDEEEENDKKIKIKQEEINLIIEKNILSSKIFNDKDSDILLLKNKLSEKKGEDKTILLYQLNRFTAKNTRDYFVHKNLKKFLTEQLDYYIKSEIIDIDTIEKKKI